MIPTTALARTLIDNGESDAQLLGDFVVGSIEGVVIEGQIVPETKCQRVLIAMRNVNGRTVTFLCDFPIEDKAEAGGRVYRDVKSV